MGRAIALIPLALLIASGCGGDDEDSTQAVTLPAITVPTTTETSPSSRDGRAARLGRAAAGKGPVTATLSKEEYIGQSDAICAEVQEIRDDAAQDVVAALRQGNYQAAAKATENALDQIRSPYAELINLPKPAGDEETLNELNDARNQVVTLTERTADALRAENNSRIRSLVRELNSVDNRADRIAIGYGFKVCGQGDG